jgi:hypothetical protein
MGRLVTMPNEICAIFTSANQDRLFSFVHDNRTIDFKTVNLKRENWDKVFNWSAYFDDIQTFRILILAYQRLLRVLPNRDEEIIASLLKNNIHSALQITSMRFDQFYDLLQDIVKDDKKLLRTIYLNALNRRSMTTLKYINYLQKNEPHFRNANFNK